MDQIIEWINCKNHVSEITKLLSNSQISRYKYTLLHIIKGYLGNIPPGSTVLYE